MFVAVQKLDTKTLQRLETAVAKSEYSQGKKLKVVTKVGRPGRSFSFAVENRTDLWADQPRHNGRLGGRDRRQDD